MSANIAVWIFVCAVVSTDLAQSCTTLFECPPMYCPSDHISKCEDGYCKCTLESPGCMNQADCFVAIVNCPPGTFSLCIHGRCVCTHYKRQTSSREKSQLGRLIA
ncbi:hypothetical protein MAR_031424 [Mya arenaria]|uniref:Uncharacterized protein n=1 Tax=Mya arenaria TaxID=6604 RepID=A0ABY7F3V7_MYAAR|nr:uncharacterized protein LOC128205426 [Mya arenaria]WAR16830.1 hypothetical protein MAR_031424 [Mya arenaria]